MDTKRSSKKIFIDLSNQQVHSPTSRKFNEMVKEWEEFKKVNHQPRYKIKKHSFLLDKEISANDLTSDKSTRNMSSKLVFFRKSKSSSKRKPIACNGLLTKLEKFKQELQGDIVKRHVKRN
ncbi:hypothetical protein SteCoe_10401 [Stentor coeruleus]|uniref:Uncharacterized protein n=1 Tax=Stentor coeruleus TaxID=5963 RepID=A0A1R2CFV2_9CILI|nr:hypothetical protein SteCoe_10401 [Stentor coeruleus]